MFYSSGGIYYHLKAWRYSRHWNFLRELLQNALQEWGDPKPKGQLLLVGASGGYCLPPAFLKKFDRLEVVDPDPLAAVVFKRRHSQSKVNWNAPTELAEGMRLSLMHTLRQFPRWPVVFCNLLGQVGLNESNFESEHKLWRETLEAELKNRPWFSFHDRYSLKLTRKQRQSLWDERGNFRLTRSYGNEALALQSLVAGFSANRQFAAEPLQMVDHLVQGIWPSAPQKESKSYVWWPLSPKQLHLLEIRSS